MNPTHPSDSATEQMLAELATWFLRKRGPAWTAEDEAALESWLSAMPAAEAASAAGSARPDPANGPGTAPGESARLHAWRQWEADWALMEQLPAASADRLRAMVQADRLRSLGATFPATTLRTPYRQNWLQGIALAGVAAMALSAGWMGWQHWQKQPLYQQIVSSDRGQQLRASLPDGSTLELDTATTLRVSFFRQRREVQLIEGQASFAVTSDSARPFSVAADRVQVTVVGTRFNVRLTPQVPGREGVEVKVQEGRVRVMGPSGLASQPEGFELVAGAQAIFDRANEKPVLGQAPLTDTPAWRNRRLSFNNVPLAEALAEMDRYAPLEITAVDPAVAQLRLTGTFDPRDAATTRRLLAAALPIRFEHGEQGYELLKRR